MATCTCAIELMLDGVSEAEISQLAVATPTTVFGGWAALAAADLQSMDELLWAFHRLNAAGLVNFGDEPLSDEQIGLDRLMGQHMGPFSIELMDLTVLTLMADETIGGDIIDLVADKPGQPVDLMTIMGVGKDGVMTVASEPPDPTDAEIEAEALDPVSASRASDLYHGHHRVLEHAT